MVNFLKRLPLFWKVFLPTNLIILLGLLVTFSVLASSAKSKDFLHYFYKDTLRYNLQLNKLDKLYNQYNLFLLKHLAAESAVEMSEIAAQAEEHGRNIEELVEVHRREHDDQDDIHHAHRDLAKMTSEFLAKV